jgi:hypothetical protein
MDPSVLISGIILSFANCPFLSPFEACIQRLDCRKDVLNKKKINCMSSRNNEELLKSMPGVTNRKGKGNYLRNRRSLLRPT